MDRALIRRLNVDPVLKQLLIRQKVAQMRSTQGFFHPRLPSLRSPFLVGSVSVTIRHLGGTVKGGRHVLVCKSCSMSNAATITLICGFVRRFCSGLSCCVPSHCGRNCNVSQGKMSCTTRANMNLVVILSYNVGTMSRVTCTHRQKVSFVVYSRRMPSSVLPPTMTVLGTGHPSGACPCRRLSNYNINFGFVRTFTVGGNVRFRRLVPLLSLITIDVTSSVIPVVKRGHVLTRRKLGRLGDGPDVKVGTVVSIYKLTRGSVAIDSVIFGVNPHVGTSKHVRGNGRTISLLARGSFSMTLRGTGRVGRCGRAHGSLSGDVARRTGRVMTGLRKLTSHHSVIVCGRR